MENVQNNIHQENRALRLDMGYLSSMNAILIFLPGAIWGPERVTSWVSSLSLDSDKLLLVTAQRSKTLRFSGWRQGAHRQETPLEEH